MSSISNVKAAHPLLSMAGGVLVDSVASVWRGLGCLPWRRVATLLVFLVGVGVVGGLVADGEWLGLLVGIVVTMLLMGGWDEMRRDRQQRSSKT